MSENKSVKFEIKIPNGCWENSEKLQGATLFCRTRYSITSILTWPVLVANVNSIVARRRKVEDRTVVIDVCDVYDDVTSVARQRRWRSWRCHGNDHVINSLFQFVIETASSWYCACIHTVNIIIDFELNQQTLSKIACSCSTVKKRKMQFSTENANYARQLYRQVLLRARISYGNSVCLSVCPGVTTRYRIKHRSDRGSGFSPYGSLGSLLSDKVIWCRWVRRFPSNEGIKEGYPTKKS